MNMGYEIVNYSPELKNSVVQLQTHLWSPDVAVNAAYLEWKYERNPYLETPLIRLATHGGQIVGMRGMYGARWQVGLPARVFTLPCAGDLVLAPDHRNRGLVRRIIEAAAHDLADSGHAYAFSLSASLVTQVSSLTAGWRRVGALETATLRAGQRTAWGRAVRHAGRLPIVRAARRGVRRFAHRSRPAPATTPGEPFRLLDRNGERSRTGLSEHVSLEQSPRPTAMAGLVERSRSDGRLRHVRDEGYFAWRFQNPLSVYRFLFWIDTRLEGYLVLQAPASADHARVTIVDWEATNARAVADLLRAAVRWGEFPALSIWSATLDPATKALLHETGFSFLDPPASIGRAHRERAGHPALLVLGVGRESTGADWALAGRRLLDLRSWDLRAIYSDGF